MQKPEEIAGGAEHFIAQRQERMKNVSMDHREWVYLREIADELTRIRFELTASREAAQLAARRT